MPLNRHSLLSYSVQAAVATFGVNVAALLVRRDSPSFTGGWRICFVTWLLRTYFSIRSALNGKAEVSRSLSVRHVLLYVNL